MHGSTANWILGGLTAIFGVVGLYVASNSHEPVGYYGGLAFFAFAVGVIFHRIKRAWDEAEAHGHGH